MEAKTLRPIPTRCGGVDMTFSENHCWPQCQPQYVVFGAATELGEQASSFTIRVARVVWNKHRTSFEFAECARYKHEYTIPSTGQMGYRYSNTGLSPCGRYVLYWTHDPTVLVCLKVPTIEEMDNALAQESTLSMEFVSSYSFPENLPGTGKAVFEFSATEPIAFLNTVDFGRYIFRFLPQLELIGSNVNDVESPPPTDLQQSLLHESPALLIANYVRLDTMPSACILYRKDFDDRQVHFADIQSETAIPIHELDHSPNREYSWSECGIAYFVYACGEGYVYILKGKMLLVQSVKAIQDQMHSPNFTVENSAGVAKFILPKSYSWLQVLRPCNPIVIKVCEAKDNLPYPKKREEVYSLDDSIAGNGRVSLLESLCNENPSVIYFPNTDFYTTLVNAYAWPPAFRKCSSKLLRFYGNTRGVTLLRRAMDMHGKISHFSHFKDLPVEIVLKVTQYIPLADDRINLAVACPATLSLMEEQDDFNMLHYARKLLFAAGAGANDLYEHGWLLRLVRFGDGMICKWLANCFQNGDYGAKVDTDLAEEILKFSSPLFDQEGR